MKYFTLLIAMMSSMAFAATTVTFDDGTSIELTDSEKLYVSTGTVYDKLESVAGNGDVTYRFRPRTPVTEGDPVVDDGGDDDGDDSGATDNSGFTTTSWDGTDRWAQCEAYDPDAEGNLVDVQAAWTEACDQDEDGKYELCDDYQPNLFGYTFADQWYYRICVYNQGG